MLSLKNLARKGLNVTHGFDVFMTVCDVERSFYWSGDILMISIIKFRDVFRHVES